MTKIAVLQVADTGPLESLVIMLRGQDYECRLPTDKFKAELRSLGCDTVLDVKGLIQGMGYSPPMKLPHADLKDLQTPGVIDLYVDIKAHRNGPKIWTKYSHLKDKTLWYRINGGKPEHVIKPGGEDCGDEVNPPCPVLTPNLWYRDLQFKGMCDVSDQPLDEAYACWPPFYRFDEYLFQNGRERQGRWEPPVCLTHNVAGWGYRDLIEPAQRMGIRCYGAGSPDGLIQHSVVARMLSNTLALVHLKTSDAPGYSLYEALAAGCPCIVSRCLIWKNRMEELFVDDETCLTFGRASHEFTPEDVPSHMMEINDALMRLKNPTENSRIGRAGHDRLKELMWHERRDHASLAEFLGRNFT